MPFAHQKAARTSEGPEYGVRNAFLKDSNVCLYFGKEIVN